MQLDLALQKCGLTFKESRVYLAVLEIGPAKTLSISQKARLKRTSTYEILKRLEAKGIISSQLKNRRKHFFVPNPEKLKNIIQDQHQIIQQITPFIVDKFNAGNKKIKVQMFEGEEGIKEIFHDSLKCQEKKILQYVSINNFLKIPGKKFMHWYVGKRAELGIFNHALQPTKKEFSDNIFGYTNKKYLRESRLIDLFFTNFICIYDHKVAMVSTEKENFGFIIESEEFSKTLKDWFWFIWQFAKPTPTKK